MKNCHARTTLLVAMRDATELANVEQSNAVVFRIEMIDGGMYYFATLNKPEYVGVADAMVRLPKRLRHAPSIAHVWHVATVTVHRTSSLRSLPSREQIRA